MASNKRRKVEPQDGNASFVSAFAARKNLWGAPVESPTVREDNQEAEGTSAKRVSGRSRPSPAADKEVPSIEKGAETKSTPTASDQNSNGGKSPAQLSGGVPGTPVLPIAAQTGTTGNDVPRRAAVQHSSFRPNKKNYQDKARGRTILKLAEGEAKRLVILGSYGLKVSEGEVTIVGAALRENMPIQFVHAPHCHALPVIRATEDTTLELSSCPEVGDLRALGRLSQVFERLWNESPQQTPSPSPKKHHGDVTFQIIYTSDDGPSRAILQDLVSPAEWNKKIASLVSSKTSEPPVVFVCGPKSSGKSTFGKILANRFITHRTSSRNQALQSVAVLDLDPGQPEYSAAGAISLVYLSKPNLSPSFCQPYQVSGKTVLRSHAIASVTPALDPEHYLECVMDLFSCYRNQRGAKVPLIINTPGWIQGTGLDILMGLIENIHPSEVVYMSRDGPGETVDGLQAACQGIPMSTLPSQESEYTSRTALHFRTMQSMSYFHAKMPSVQHDQPGWDPRPLTAIPPWRVRFKGPNRGVFGLLCYDYQPPPNLLVEAINGMVVGLVVIENAAAWRDLLTDMSVDTNSKMELHGKTSNSDPISNEAAAFPQTPEGITFIPNPSGRTLDPRHSRMVGLGLIRGVDVGRGDLHILTPLPDSTIAMFAKDWKNLVLVAGKFDTPSWAYTEDLYMRSSSGSGTDNASQGAVEVIDEDTDDDSSQGGYEEDVGSSREYTKSPWVELLHGNQKRTVGSRVWRVRRDLGRSGNGP